MSKVLNKNDGCVMIPKCQECVNPCKRYVAEFLISSMLENKNSFLCKNFSKPKVERKSKGGIV